MVDSCDLVARALKFIRHVKILKQTFKTDLNAVAKTDSLDLCVSLHVSGNDRHGVGVVQKPSVGAYLLHVSGNFL